MKNEIRTAESVRRGHPDKLCDQVADRILDAHLTQDPNARVAVEVFVTAGKMIIAGEVTGATQVEYDKIAWGVIREIGYKKGDLSKDANGRFEIEVLVHSQSPDISRAVDRAGAGDQGIVIGYATSESEAYLPLPFVLATELCRSLDEAMRSGKLPFLRPDGKAQVTMRYDADGTPSEVIAVVISAQHEPNVCADCLREAIMREVVAPTIPAGYLTENTKYHINPSEQFTLGGPAADTGLTGRKLMVDSYGPAIRHGGGAYSGKCPTKIDRAGAYMARYIAKNIVAAKLADRCEVELAYAIGMTEPLAVSINTFGTGNAPDEMLASIVQEVFDLTPAGIIKTLDLRKPIYASLAVYGHFGRNGLSWERTNMTGLLQHEVNCRLI